MLYTVRHGIWEEDATIPMDHHIGSRIMEGGWGGKSRFTIKGSASNIYMQHLGSIYVNKNFLQYFFFSFY